MDNLENDESLQSFERGLKKSIDAFYQSNGGRKRKTNTRQPSKTKQTSHNKHTIITLSKKLSLIETPNGQHNAFLSDGVVLTDTTAIKTALYNELLIESKPTYFGSKLELVVTANVTDLYTKERFILNGGINGFYITK